MKWALLAVLLAALLYFLWSSQQQDASSSSNSIWPLDWVNDSGGADTADASASDPIGEVITTVTDAIKNTFNGIVSSLASYVALPQNVSDLIEKYAAIYGVDPNLAKAQAWAESRGNENARSSVGAIGVFQLMPATAAELGVDPYDVEQNIEGGIKYLSQQLKRFGGDYSKALAAYNAGAGNVIKYGGIPPFAETQNYVAKILKAIGLS